MMATPAPQPELIVVGNTRVANAYGLPKDATILLERDVFATMRDGARLATNVFRPAAPGKYPVLMHMAHTGKDRFPGDRVYRNIEDSGGIVASELHVGVKKFDVHGNEVHLMDFDHCEKGMVASGRLRVSHHELDEAKSTPWRPWHKH